DLFGPTGNEGLVDDSADYPRAQTLRRKANGDAAQAGPDAGQWADDRAFFGRVPDQQSRPPRIYHRRGCDGRSRGPDLPWQDTLVARWYRRHPARSCAVLESVERPDCARTRKYGRRNPPLRDLTVSSSRR